MMVSFLPNIGPTSPERPIYTWAARDSGLMKSSCIPRRASAQNVSIESDCARIPACGRMEPERSRAHGAIGVTGDIHDFGMFPRVTMNAARFSRVWDFVERRVPRICPLSAGCAYGCEPPCAASAGEQSRGGGTIRVREGVLRDGVVTLRADGATRRDTWGMVLGWAGSGGAMRVAGAFTGCAMWRAAA